MYVLVVGYVARPASSGEKLRLDEFLTAVSRSQVASADILADDDRIVGTRSGGTRYWVDISGNHESLFARVSGALEAAGVPTEVTRQPIKRIVGPIQVLIPALIVVDGILVLYLLGRRPGEDLAGFGRAGARQEAGDGSEARVTFADLAGVDEAVEELREICQYLADPGRYAAMGASAPKGVLLDGPPGTGKTRLARAVAGESDVPFFSISGSDFVEMYVGVGAARIRDLFATAKAVAPAIVFIDELDAVGRARTVSPTGGGDERESSLNQLLVEMDGFAAGAGVVVMAATNRPDILDAALLRPGRFDRKVTVDLPDLRGRQGILAVHARGKPLGPDADLAAVARRTVGFSGAELANVLNEAALLATRRGSTTVGAALLSEAVERVVSGPQRASRVLHADDKRRIAYHEAGHAVAASALPGADRVAKVSIVARGHAGGMTWYLPESDRVVATRSQLLDRITALLGGRAAEEVVYGESSTGAADDLARASALVRRMVGELGMSERLGPLSIAPVAGSAGPDGPPWSERLLSTMDAELEAMLRDAALRATTVLHANRAVLDRLAAVLVDEESVEDEALDTILSAVRPLAPAAPGVVLAVAG
jgi:cell division protease FtsH